MLGRLRDELLISVTEDVTFAVWQDADWLGAERGG